MNKLIKNLMITAAISVAIVGAYTPATASANGGSWQKNSVGWWYRNSDGSWPRSQWKHINGKWYYFDGGGYIIHSRWERIDGKWYYFETSGQMIENTWKMISGKWYYFNRSGHMLSNQWVGDYYLGKDGDMLKNTVTPDNYVVGGDGKWDKRFSRELAEKAKSPLNNLYKVNRSKYSVAGDLTLGKRNEYNTALQLLETIYPEYNAVDNAKRAIKNIIGQRDNDNNPYDWASKDSSIRNLTAWHVNANSHSYYMFSQEEVKKAFDELSREIDFAKFFQGQAVKALKNIDSYKHTSKTQYEKDLTKHGFTKEEIDNAFKVLKIDFVHNAQQEANKSLKKHTYTASKQQLINYLKESILFTKEEAEEAVNRLGYDFKINIRHWIEQHVLAENAWAALNSKSHIIHHMTHFDEFVESEVREVLAEYNINYTERARLRAIYILKNAKYRRSDLEKTLVDYWKFTKEEATDAVKDLKNENLID